MASNFEDYGMKCGQAPTITKFLRYESAINLTLGNVFHGECSVGAFTYISAHGTFTETSFGRFCSVADWVCTGPGQHPTHLLSTHPFVCDPTDNAAALASFPSYRAVVSRMPFTPAPMRRGVSYSPKVTVGNDVWIGTRVVIMNGITIGDGAIIGTGAIVTKDVPPYAVVVGVPAKVIRYRFDRATIDRLLELQWWNYDMSHVSNMVDYGRVEAVIEFMTDRIAAGQLPKFAAKRYEMRQNGGGYHVGAFPPAGAR